MSKVSQVVDCFYVLPDKSWWTAKAVELDCVASEVSVLSRFQKKDSLNPNIIAVAEIYSAPILVFTTDGGSFRIGFVYSDTKIDITSLSTEDQLLFKQPD